MTGMEIWLFLPTSFLSPETLAFYEVLVILGLACCLIHLRKGGRKGRGTVPLHLSTHPSGMTDGGILAALLELDILSHLLSHRIYILPTIEATYCC